MSQWLARAVNLAAIRDTEELADKYAVEVCEELGLRAVCVLAPSSDGRTLITRYKGRQLEWAVDDFTNPFAHVLQSPEPVLFDEQKRLYWLEDEGFRTFVTDSSPQESIFIQPLPPKEHSVQLMVVLMGNAEQLKPLAESEHWHEFNRFFVLQWQIASGIAQQLNKETVLTESIARIRQEEHTRELAVRLKSQLIGSSDVMHQVREQVITAAQSGLTVLIQGETGTGKELVAQAVHKMSSRSHKPFVAINCAAIPENLLESELFGYERGAFSGADKAKKGLLAEADGGTLFLDEIGDMPVMLQAKLLRMLENRTYRPVGAKEEISLDFRLVAATHVHLREQVEKNQFRSDLYYRLNQYPLDLPPLAERKEDLSELALHFISSYNKSRGTEVTGIRYAALKFLREYDFPGNVRELRNVIEFACAQTASGDEIDATSFGKRTFQKKSQDANTVSSKEENEHPFSQIDNLRQELLNYEAAIIKSRLKQYDGNKTKVAESLNLPKRTLAHKCRKLEIL